MSIPCEHWTAVDSHGRCAKRGVTVSRAVCAACLSRPELRQPRPVQPDCPPHTDWCERYGLPTGPDACEACTAARREWPEFAQHMRNVGRLYGALSCSHRIDTGTTVTRVCCGGQMKQVPVFRCGRDGQEPAPCLRCRDRTVEQPATGRVQTEHHGPANLPPNGASAGTVHTFTPGETHTPSKRANSRLPSLSTPSFPPANVPETHP